MLQKADGTRPQLGELLQDCLVVLLNKLLNPIGLNVDYIS